MELREKRVLVVGAASGIGAAAARVCQREGAEVMKADLNPADDGAFVDITVEESCRQLADIVRNRWGSLDGLAITAGMAHMRRIEEQRSDAWHRLLDVNVVGASNLIAAMLPFLGPGSSVVTVASSTAHRSYPGMAAYAASKAALVRWSMACAREVVDRGVRVNCVSPGPVDTPMLRGDAPPGLPPDEFVGMVGRLTAVGRVGTPPEIAEPISFLLSDRAAFITGSVVLVDGGETVFDGAIADELH